MTDAIKRRYFQHVMSINLIAYIICWSIALISYFIHNIFTFFISLILMYFTLLVAMLFKYWQEKKYRKIEVNVKEYIMKDLISYIFFTVIALALFLEKDLQENRVIIFVIFNFLAFTVLLISTLNPMAKIWKRNAKRINNREFEEMVKELAKNMKIGKVEIGILPWKKLKIANALQTGTKRVYVFISDYLFENLSLNENLAIVAHEFAHIKLRHLLKIQVFLSSVLLGMAYPYFLIPIFLGDNLTASILQVIVIWGGIIALSFFLTVIRRRFETQADLLAARYVSPVYLISALNKLSDLNFIPKEISKAWGLSHPSISKRIKNLEQMQKSEREG